MLKVTHIATPSKWDYNPGGPDGPYAMFSIDNRTLRIPVHVHSDQLRSLVGIGPCEVTITVRPLDEPPAIAIEPIPIHVKKKPLETIAPTTGQLMALVAIALFVTVAVFVCLFMFRS